MERTETTRKTLAVGRSTLTAKPQAPGEKNLKQQLPEPSALPGSTGSGLGREDSVARTQENGVRVRVRASDNTNGGAVETEIAKMTGGSGSSSSPFKIKENEGEGVVGGSVNVMGSNSVLGVKKKEEQGCEKIAAASGRGAKSGSIGGRSGKKAVSKIEVKEGRDLNKKYGYEENGTPLSENGEDPDDLMLEMSEKKDEEEEEEDVGYEECEYAVGDFVWGKIKSHPWWPGRIYNPSDASEYAAKYSHKDHLLVAYFGDGTFAWCYPSQLQPFEDNFDEMSKQTNSKNFVKAVEGALDEFSRVVELEMTCSCALKGNKVGFARPVAMNAGIKEGVVVPEGGIGQHSIAQFELAKFLANLRYIARVVSVNSVLELNVLKTQLAAFYCAKGVYELPRYTEPEYIVGLEDKIRSNGECNGEVDVPIQGPFEEDWLSLPVSPGFNKTGKMSSQKWPMISEDKLYQRRKQKSIAEIMGGEMNVKPKNNEENMAKEGIHSGKLASISSRRKKKGSDEAETRASDNLPYPPGQKKKIKLSETLITTENKVPRVENTSGWANEETRKGRVSWERKAKRSSHVKDDDDDGVREGIENGSVSRERKKSKYLSPPYTSPNWGERNSSFKKDSKLEFLEVASVARVGERMSKAAGLLVGSPIVKCSAETFQKNVSRELSTERDTSGGLNPETPKQGEKKIDPMATKASANKVLSQIRSAALNPPYAREGKSLDMIRVFFSAFRSSVYRDGSNYKAYNKRRTRRNRKSLDSVPVSLERDLNRTDDNSVERKSLRMRNKKNEAKSDMHEHKQAAGASDTKTKDKETEGKAPSAALFLSFGPGVSMPSKDDLIAKYSKFGSLNEVETEVLYNSFCAQVVFVKSSDAEQAFKDSMRMSSSGDTKISYRLRYLSGTSRIRERDENRRPKASSSRIKERGKNSSSRTKEDGKTPGENSSIQLIRQKLEMMTSMLEKSDGNMTQEMKINLESEMKGLLEKVRTMAGSSSP